MSDIYHIDTEKALGKFQERVSQLEGIIEVNIISDFESLATEVQGLLDQYSNNLDDLESARELIEEYETD